MVKKRKAAAPLEPPAPEESESEEEEEEEEVEESDEEKEESSEEEEDGSEESRREALIALLHPYTKDQLVNILKEAATKNADLVCSLIKLAESDPIHRKLFVHGLAPDVTKEILTAAFKPYGQIEECNAVLDRATGRCKGFGFVQFKTRADARKALKEPQKRIGTRTASCQLAAAGPHGSVTSNAGPGPDLGGRRLYVGSVGPDINPGRLRGFFAKYGEIEEGPKGLSQGSGKFRGFAIFVYKTEEGLRRALQDPTKDFDGRKLDCSVYVESRGSKPAPAAAVASTTATMTGLSNVGLQSLPVQGLVRQNFNPGAAALLGQNPSLGGLFNPLIGGFSGNSLNPTTSYAPAVPTRNQYGLIGLSGAGLGSYQGSLSGQRSAPTSGGQSGAGSLVKLPTYFRR